jgi:hypothetical protein
LVVASILRGKTRTVLDIGQASLGTRRVAGLNVSGLHIGRHLVFFQLLRICLDSS